MVFLLLLWGVVLAKVSYDRGQLQQRAVELAR